MVSHQVNRGGALYFICRQYRLLFGRDGSDSVLAQGLRDVLQACSSVLLQFDDEVHDMAPSNSIALSQAPRHAREQNWLFGKNHNENSLILYFDISQFSLGSTDVLLVSSMLQGGLLNNCNFDDLIKRTAIWCFK